VLGLAGLLDQPVIADLVSVLRVLHDPTAGSELIRVLGGARWRIGPADLVALNGLARWLADRMAAGDPCDRAAVFDAAAAAVVKPIGSGNPSAERGGGGRFPMPANRLPPRIDP